MWYKYMYRGQLQYQIKRALNKTRRTIFYSFLFTVPVPLAVLCKFWYPTPSPSAIIGFVCSLFLCSLWAHGALCYPSSLCTCAALRLFSCFLSCSLFACIHCTISQLFARFYLGFLLACVSLH